jgi:DNA-3-methyladenine glycosylase II
MRDNATMDVDPIDYLSKKDPVLARLIRDVGAYTFAPQPARSPFEALVRAVAHQQLNGTAAETILRRFIALFPKRTFPHPGDIPKVPDRAIRAAGFSGAKIAAIRDISAKTIHGIIPSSSLIKHLPDDEIIERLTTVRGVGRWTVEMLLIFKLGRMDVLPADDFGVRYGFKAAYKRKEMPAPKELLAFGERWRPYRTIGAWYMWRASDIERKRIAKPKKA